MKVIEKKASFFRNTSTITVFTVFRLLTDFVCLYTYEFWFSLCKIARSSVILLLPLFTKLNISVFINKEYVTLAVFINKEYVTLAVFINK
jgi:hypothetical protein